MRAQVQFKRGSGTQVSASVLVLGTGTDPVPTAASAKITPGDNKAVFEFRDLEVDRIYVGLSFDAGSAVTLPVALYVWDTLSERYYRADGGTLTSGQLTYLKCPSPPAPPQNQASMGQPSNAVSCYLVVSDNASSNVAVTIIAGADRANF